MKLVEIKNSLHPGGWTDVLTVVRERWPDRAFEIQENVWGKLTEQAGWKTKVEVQSDKPGVVETHVRRLVLADYLEALEHPISGTLASLAYMALQACGLPVPGDPDWRKPAARWKEV